jgi:hypothetical protein
VPLGAPTASPADRFRTRWTRLDHRNPSARAYMEADDSLIPRLRFFGVESSLRFTDDVYLDFVTSRLVLGRNRHNKPFTTQLRGCPGTRELGSRLRARLSDLVRRGELQFST